VHSRSFRCPASRWSRPGRPHFASSFLRTAVLTDGVDPSVSCAPCEPGVRAVPFRRGALPTDGMQTNARCASGKLLTAGCGGTTTTTTTIISVAAQTSTASARTRHHHQPAPKPSTPSTRTTTITTRSTTTATQSTPSPTTTTIAGVTSDGAVLLLDHGSVYSVGSADQSTVSGWSERDDVSVDDSSIWIVDSAALRYFHRWSSSAVTGRRRPIVSNHHAER
jgi:hypothetical protein